MATVCSSHQRAERKGVRFGKGGFMGGPPGEVKERKKGAVIKIIANFSGGEHFFDSTPAMLSGG